MVLMKKNGRHFIAAEGHVDVAKVLIQNGANVNALRETNARHFTSQLKVDMLALQSVDSKRLT